MGSQARQDLNQLAEAQKVPDIKNPGALSGRKLGEYEVLDVIGKFLASFVALRLVEEHGILR